MKRVICSFLVFMPLTLLLANSVKVSNWHYYKDINGWTSSSKSNYTSGIVELDAQINKKRNKYDLRVMLGTRELPYFTRFMSIETQKSKRFPVEIIYEKVIKKKKTVLIKLPEIKTYENIHSIEFRLPWSYEGSVSISYGRTPDNMSYGSRQRLFRYSGSQKRSTLILPRLKKEKYLRLTYDNKTKLRPLYVYAVADNKNIDYELSSEDGSFEIEAGEKNNQVISIANDNKRPVYRIELKIKQKRFSREILVYRFDNTSREYILEYNGRIVSRNLKNNTQMISLNQTVFDSVRIVIENEDDQPLEIESVKVFAPKEELIIKLPDVSTLDEKSRNKKLLLYYGNEYAKRPVYDFDTTRQKTSRKSMLLLSASKEIENPEFSYSLIEPPISIYLIRILFILGIVLTAFPAYKTFRNLKNKNEE